jgi:hypothetical protein
VSGHNGTPIFPPIVKIFMPEYLASPDLIFTLVISLNMSCPGGDPPESRKPIIF